MIEFWARTVIEDDAAAQSAEAAGLHHRFEDALEGLKWVLARGPTRGWPLYPPDMKLRVYVQGSDNLAGTPEIWLVYSYDADQVTIHALKAVAPHD